LTAALSAVRGVRRVRVIFRPGPHRVSVQPVVGPRKVSKVRGLTAGLTAANRRLNFKLKFNLALTAADHHPRVCPPLGRPGPRTPDRPAPTAGSGPDRDGSPTVRAEFYPSPPGVYPARRAPPAAARRARALDRRSRRTAGAPFIIYSP